ncbi:lipoprotein [Deltaproteobacteria bacterium]|nr:lipoprotein [Deltaproteobacteria bacterium]
MKFARIAFCIALFMMIGCKSTFNTAPVLELRDQSVSKTVPLKDMERCIKEAGIRLGWKMDTVSPSVIEGTLNLRQHTAVVTIPFTQTNYSILYKDSDNLYAENGQIHKSYNRWVKNLEKEIGIELSRLAIR